MTSNTPEPNHRELLQNAVKATITERYPQLEETQIQSWIELITEEPTAVQARAIAFQAVITSGEQTHPVRVMNSVSILAAHLAEFIGIEDFKDFAANMGTIDLGRGVLEEEFKHIKELAVTPGTVRYTQAKVLEHIYRTDLHKKDGTGYRSPWITESTRIAFDAFLERTNLPLVTGEDDEVLQTTQTTLGAAGALEEAFGAVNKYFTNQDKQSLDRINQQLVDNPDDTTLQSQKEQIESRLRSKTTFIHIGPSFSATDNEAQGFGMIETPQLSFENGFVIDEAYIAQVGEIIEKTGNACLIIEDTPNPLGRRLTADEWELLTGLMQKYPKLICIMDHAYIGLAQDKDVSDITSFRTKFVERIISAASLSKSTASPGKRIGGIIFPNRGELGRAMKEFYSVTNPSKRIEDEAYVLAQLQLLLAGDNEYDINKLIAIAIKQSGKKIDQITRLLKAEYYYEFHEELDTDELEQKIKKLTKSLSDDIPTELSQIYCKKEDTRYVEKEVSKMFKERTTALYNMLNETNRFPQIIRPENTMYVFAKLPDGMNAKELYKQTGIAAVPGEAFGSGGEGWIRLSIGTLTLKDIAEMGEILKTTFAPAE